MTTLLPEHDPDNAAFDFIDTLLLARQTDNPSAEQMDAEYEAVVLAQEFLAHAGFEYALELADENPELALKLWVVCCELHPEAEPYYHVPSRAPLAEVAK